MPNFETHLKLGIISGLIGSGIFYLLFKDNFIVGSILCFLFASISSLFADIDTKSNISKFVFVGLVGAVAVAFVINQLIPALIIAAIVLGIHFLVPHRTLTHTATAAVIFGAIVFFLCYPFIGISSAVIGVTTILAYISHIIIDRI